MTEWRYYNYAVVPSSSPHEDVDCTEIIDGSIWKKFPKALMARWTTDWDCEQKTNWWYCIRDGKFDLNDLSSSSRKNIKRGLKKTFIKEINPLDYVPELYRVYAEASKKYKNGGDILSEEEFVKNDLSVPNSTFFAGFEAETDILTGWLKVREYDEYCNTVSAKFWPEYQNTRVSDALYATVLDKYLNEKNKMYVNSGERNLIHITNTQEYKEEHFLYRKAYCRLHIEYNPKIRLLIKIIYPMRKLLKLFDKIRYVHMIRGVLLMEEVKRKDEKIV